MRNCQNIGNVFNLIKTNLPHGEDLYKARRYSQSHSHPQIVITALRDILVPFGGKLAEYDGNSGPSLEFVFQELVEGRKTATFFLFTMIREKQVLSAWEM